MSVELVATLDSEHVRLQGFPALLSRKSEGAATGEEPVSGAYHCLVSLVHGELMVWDVGPGGGTLVNGAAVTRATLKPGDTLRLGGTQFQVNYTQHTRRYLHGVRS